LVSFPVRRALLLLLCLLPEWAWADYVRVDRNANVYAAANRNSAVLENIRPGESSEPIYLLLAADQLQNGYHQVHLRQGTGNGWIYKSQVRKFGGDPPGTDRSHVYGGFPDASQVGDQIIRLQNAAYVVGYSETKSNPLWVAYRLGRDQGHSCPRLTRFLTDDRTQARVTHNDYTNAGYDRGHMAPSHNIGSRYGCPAQNETYRMSNIAPQLAMLNQRPWGGLENLERDFATSSSQIWVITGSIFDQVWLNRLCSGIEIPTAFYKIIVRETSGTPDVLAVIFDQDTKPGTRLSTLVKTVREIEQRTGINFLAELPDVVENAIETTRATDVVWRLDSTLDTDFRPETRKPCLMPRIRRDQAPDA
jgi:endonuclease G